VNINATVSFSVPQAIAIAEAMERGLARRDEEGLSTEDMTPVTTIMIGRTDDWMQVVTKRDGITVNPTFLPWAGIAVFKRAYGLYQERGYRPRLLAAAYRHHLHWSELIGGDVVLTIPSAWQKLFNASDVNVRERIGDPVAPEIVQELYDRIPDFRGTKDTGNGHRESGTAAIEQFTETKTVFLDYSGTLQRAHIDEPTGDTS